MNWKYTTRVFENEMEVFPIGGSAFGIEYSQRDDGCLLYEQDFSGDLIFRGADYLFFSNHNRSINRCRDITIWIDQICGQVSTRIFNGRISMNDGEWDDVNCIVSFKIDFVSISDCIDLNKNMPVDLFESIPPAKRIEINLLDPSIELEISDQDKLVTCIGTPYCTSGDDIAYWDGAGNPYDGKWQLYTRQLTAVQVGGTVPTYEVTLRSKWVREITYVSCSQSLGGEWIFVNDTCSDPNPLLRRKKYARNANVIECKEWTGVLSRGKDCKVLGMADGGEGQINTIDNGMKLEDGIMAFMHEFCGGLAVQSNFFQINPTIVSNINYVTGLETKTNNIILFQNSDINRATASQNARKAWFTFDKLMQSLRNMFNIAWKIEGQKIIIEHISYFDKDLGLDLTDPKYSKYMTNANKYSYTNEKIPEREEWQWEYKDYSGDFKGVPIYYSGGCVKSQNNVKNYTIEGINTDVILALDKGDDSPISNDGLTMVATRIIEGVYSIITEEGILANSKMNNSLAISQLLRDYHRYNRPLPSGNMNERETSFFSVIPTKKGEKLMIPLCCGDIFKPEDQVVTVLGIGTVDKANYDFKTSTLTLDLLYQNF